MKSQEPTIIDISSSEKKYTHPAYGVVTVSRPQSHPPVHLFGSEIGHSHYISVSVRKAELTKDLNRDWVFPREELIEFHLSESQWAKFVSGAGRSQATPVTLSRISSGSLEGVPSIRIPEQSRKDEFNQDFKEKLTECLQEISGLTQQLRELADSKSVSKVQLRKIADTLSNQVGNLPENLSFAVESFKEITESMVEEAKAEVEAYTLDVIHSAGIKQITQQAHLLSEAPEDSQV